ncbi:DUF3027 domain-containing protein [Candidatus Aquiluna sp. UB-MaderosW2red]|uniref:DUF3027 domain-containing protein n=1 Tax=Candidatus Aquiluna sp. UB-MaderosW2red TaxID=1855377 RepID=UPI000875C341|nr:DUF3027 domain-containing protein [Candidatus Aquiluna sp. UB-MaderosW2red]SCX08512.1 Protein of unknown function [Candidatus Aquiluna sp. UB-MaderosW2red]
MKANNQDFALSALKETTNHAQIGDFIAEVESPKGVIEVRFAALMRGYEGWVWVITLTSPDKRKGISVSEVNLMAGPDAVLSPNWVPWAERLAEFRKQLRAEGKAQTDAEADELIKGMALGFADGEESEDSESDADQGGVKPPQKTRVRQRRIKRQEDDQDQDPESASD